MCLYYVSHWRNSRRIRLTSGVTILLLTEILRDTLPLACESTERLPLFSVTSV